MQDVLVRQALKSQYRAALSMVRHAIEQCPDGLWNRKTEMPRFWQIAYHTLFFGNLYMVQGLDVFQPWAKHREEAPSLDEVEFPPYTREELLDYADQIGAMIDSTIDGLDLETQESGFYWYKIPKLDHEILSVRHMMEHIGQMDALLRIDGQEGIDWKT